MLELKATQVMLTQVLRDRQDNSFAPNGFAHGITPCFPTAFPCTTDDFPPDFSKVRLTSTVRDVVLVHVGLRVLDRLGIQCVHRIPSGSVELTIGKFAQYVRTALDPAVTTTKLITGWCHHDRVRTARAIGNPVVGAIS